jgi:hypothetical protein
VGCFKNGNVVSGFIKCNFLLIKLLLISQAGLRCRVRRKYVSYSRLSSDVQLPICRRAVQRKNPWFWNVGWQTDSSDIPIRNKYVNSNRIPVSEWKGHLMVFTSPTNI